MNYCWLIWQYSQVLIWINAFDSQNIWYQSFTFWLAQLWHVEKEKVPAEFYAWANYLGSRLSFSQLISWHTRWQIRIFSVITCLVSLGCWTAHKKPQSVHSSTHMRRWYRQFWSEAGVNCIQEKMDSEKQMAEVVLLKVQVVKIRR